MEESYEANIRWIEELVTTPEHRRFGDRTSFNPLTSQPSPTEHVLRGSRSFAARSFRSRPSANSLRVPSNRSNNENFAASAFEDSRPSIHLNPQPVARVLGEIPANGQVIRQGPCHTGRSPTPSIKKKKAEAIVKAHGSPTHVRVTAGGRIVPCDQSPLCHPRYGYSAVKTNGGLIKFAPNYPAKPQWTQATENGFVAQDQQGNLCQIVDGTILRLNEVDGALRLYMPAPNLNVTQRGPSLGPIGAPLVQNSSQHNAAAFANPAAAPEPSAESQITALELEYTKLEHELKDVDKTEVIHGRTMGKVAKDALIAKRRELVMNMDKIRKAIKGLKSRPPPNAPTSPRAMISRQSVSPPRSRVPPFLQKSQPDNDVAQPPFGGFGNGPPTVFGGGQSAQQPPPSPEENYTGHPWAMPPPGMFAPPPPFDGGMAPPFVVFPHSASLGVLGDQLPSRIPDEIPQNDGARSMADLLVGSPGQSHAVTIRAPDTKPANNLKSSLNPMSPAYKPGVPSAKDRVPTPLSPLRQLQPPFQSQTGSTATIETISPARKSTHLQSSSVSSFATVDFFPRNTGEYSLRPDPSDGKENTDPEPPATGPHVSPVTPRGQQQTIYRAPAPPPGTPVYQDQGAAKASNFQLPRLELPNRSTHNVSPKSKREWLFIQEHPDAVTAHAASSPEKTSPEQEGTGVIDIARGAGETSHKSRDWSEGFQAAIQRQPIGNRAGDAFNGYIAGLMKLQTVESSIGEKRTVEPSNASSLSRCPSAAMSSQVQMIQKSAPSPRPHIETASRNMDTLKQAVFAPHNENAILTPAVDGPHVNDGSFNLGAWAKKNQAYPFPERTSSAINRREVASEVNIGAKGYTSSSRSHADSAHAGEMPTNPRIVYGNAPATANRISSMMSVESSMWRKSRIMTPSEWKTGTIGMAAGMATGYFANAHFDGTHDIPTSLRMPGQYTDAVSITGANQSQRVTSVTSSNPGRFREGSLDGLSDPAVSPSQPISPKLTPRDSPVKVSPKRKDSTPGKGPSPAKAKFEHMAEKVGIKVASTGKSSNTASTEPVSPTGKTGRRWRDVWKRGGRDTEE